MIEKIKSVLLFLLVGLSLFLTYQLWYGQKPAQLIAEDVYERIIVEQPRPLEEVVTPEKIVVNIEEGHYILREGNPHYIKLWETVSQIMQEVDNTSIVRDDMPDEGSQNLLTFYLKPELPVGADLPWLPEVSGSTVSVIKLNSFEDKVWLELLEKTNDTLSLLLSPENAEMFNGLTTDAAAENQVIYTILTADLLSAALEQDLDIMAPIYVPLETVNMKRLILRPEEIDRDLILKTFFIDYSMARIIEEKDGGLIYTDGDKGLRLTNTGFEYSTPRLKEGQATSSYPDALFNSSNVLSYHGGWSEGLRLEDLYLTGWGRAAYYTAEWQIYHHGYPLFTKKGTSAFFNDRGLIHYARYVFSPVNDSLENGEQLSTAVWSDALQKAVNLFKAQLTEIESGLRLEAMKLGYAVTGSETAYKGDPVWFIQINGEEFFLKVDDLEPLSEEELL